MAETEQVIRGRARPLGNVRDGVYGGGRPIRRGLSWRECRRDYRRIPQTSWVIHTEDAFRPARFGWLISTGQLAAGDLGLGLI